MNDDLDRWGPTRRPKGKARSLTPEQLEFVGQLQLRALALRTASDGELSITEAVHLAAVQLGLEAPQELDE
ncbi:hypothetical protein [Streptomyces goshikiensis]|uniref:hypothetical protein n=1 Tax=Streptomyces goshikiensis TaxID=1942 RepID=UPI002E0FF888|nr:hypothetical protein OG224_06855 [Streptomyces goshikiensis]